MTSDSSIVLSASPTASPTLTPDLRSSSAAARSRGFSLMLATSCPRATRQHLSADTTSRGSTHPCALVRVAGALHGLAVLEAVDVALELLDVVLQVPVLPQLRPQRLHERRERAPRRLVPPPRARRERARRRVSGQRARADHAHIRGKYACMRGGAAGDVDERAAEVLREHRTRRRRREEERDALDEIRRT
jgi:hypothetical protein